MRIIAGIGEIDVLVAADEVLPAAPGPVGVLNPGLGDPTGRHLRCPKWTTLDAEEADEDAYRAEQAAEIDRLGLPGLRVHYLGLRPPLGPLAEADLVAALSELVGFDPEPGVYCLAPAPAPSRPGAHGAHVGRSADRPGVRAAAAPLPEPRAGRGARSADRRGLLIRGRLSWRPPSRAARG